MKRIIKLFLFSFMIIIACPSIACADPVTAESTTDASASSSAENATSSADWNAVMDAIVKVESNGNRMAKRGNSVGVMQITPMLVKECNRILRKKKSKKRFKLSDRFNISKSREMFILFQSFYNPMNSIEKAIRSWNGGIHYSVTKTQQYFNKVMNALK
ncbi:MAG TPA: hypothetical protein DCS83_07910 [Prevotella sp.]|nr:hypothetical protein [Prevotella sp.]